MEEILVEGYSWSQVHYQTMVEVLAAVSRSIKEPEIYDNLHSDTDEKPPRDDNYTDQNDRKGIGIVIEKTQDVAEQSEAGANRLDTDLVIESFLATTNQRLEKLENIVANLKEALDRREERVDGVLGQFERLQHEYDTRITETSQRHEQLVKDVSRLLVYCGFLQIDDPGTLQHDHLKQLAATQKHEASPLMFVWIEVLQAKLKESESKATVSCRPPRKENDDIVEITDDESDVASGKPTISSAVESSSKTSQLPKGRAESLPAPITVNACCVDFTRQELAGCLGGGTQSLIVKIASATKSHLATSQDVDVYLCPNLDNNPWCPANPGEHGYIFVGLGREHATFLEEEYRHVFVGKKVAGQSRLSMSYVGFYRCFRVEALTVDEWASLSTGVSVLAFTHIPELTPSQFRRGYSEITLSKTRANLKGAEHTGERATSTGNVEADYDSGAIRVPCVRIICIGYNTELAEGILSASATLSSSAVVERRRTKRPRRRRLPRTIAPTSIDSDWDGDMSELSELSDSSDEGETSNSPAKKQKC
ncbi:hypothetical protein VNI00_001484 [Paramarasmius palmivorus]|uniref:DUF6697 domain-containing protein n=1 Tax=Paramarasmius palmivorus TaxID=297713 RepID=A0AAW0E304_9AGAR